MNVATQESFSPQEIEAIQQQHLQEFLTTLGEMTFAMEQKLPGLSGQLHKMNDLLRTYPETVALLSPEQIGQLVKGVIQESRVQFSMGATVGRGNAGKDLMKKLNAGSIDLNSIQF